jgi:glycosyltransferase involved in cell wall biosynthesis
MDIEQHIEEQKVVIVMPTYNNGRTLEDMLRALLVLTPHIIVVNDGSTDDTSSILSRYASRLTIIDYPKNRGKGYALKRGFAEAIARGYRYALTIDSDGQHRVSSIPAFLDTLDAHPDSMIVGTRSFDAAGMPRGNTFANKFSNFWFHLQTGSNFPDTQSGFRLYPLDILKQMRLFTRRYETELEILVRMAWRGVPLIALPVEIYYAPASERVTHFRPYYDFFRISVLNTFLTFWAIAYERPKMIIKRL